MDFLLEIKGMLKHVLLPGISLFCELFWNLSSRDPFNDL